MKIPLIAFFALTGILAAEPLTQHDRDYAMSLFHSTRKQFLDSVAGLSPEQLQFKAGPDRWSIMEVAEHIALSEKTISDLIKNQILKAPANPEKRAEDKIQDNEQIEKLITNRSSKFQAPEMLKPKRTYSSLDALVADFKKNRDANIEYMQNTNESMLDHFMKHPAFGELDAYQWMLFLAGHSERHTLQILEVKADPNFPKH